MSGKNKKMNKTSNDDSQTGNHSKTDPHNNPEPEKPPTCCPSHQTDNKPLNAENVHKMLRTLEDQVFAKIYCTFKCYGKFNVASVTRQIKEFESLPERHKSYLPDHIETLHEKITCIQHNQQILNEILADQKGRLNLSIPIDFRQLEFEKINSQVLHQICREWSDEGSTQRAQSFSPIVNALHGLQKAGKLLDGDIVVPGCGLGRLCFDISEKLGQGTIGNEHSFYMLFTSQYILTKMATGWF